jgi:hypothetical protein
MKISAITILLATSSAPFTTARVGGESNSKRELLSFMPCTEDVKECSDGSYVSRDPSNECKFDPCPVFKACTRDRKTCPDGSTVGRNGFKNCAFDPCPSGPVMCGADVEICEDGTAVSRDPYNFCEFEPCPSDLMCDMDVKRCEDGSYVSRDPNNGCEFEACPSDIVCAMDVKQCEDGSAVSRNPNLNCDFDECPLPMCGMDVKTCEDGSNVSRNPLNNCEFEACPVAIAYPDCTKVEGLDKTCLSCCAETFQSYRDDKCGDNMDCHDVNVPTYLKCEDQCVHSCETQCIVQDKGCVDRCDKDASSEDRNACLLECNDWWWTCTGNCKAERWDDIVTIYMTPTPNGSENAAVSRASPSFVEKPKSKTP